jgi:hypothetical protein
MCQYTPDKYYSDDHHIAKIRILQTALTHLKKNTWRLNRLEQLEYRHEQYRYLGKQYGIPADLCSVDELYGKIDDGSQLERYRCVPICHYYRMLMEDTPGFTRSTDQSRESSSRPHNSSRSRSDDTTRSSSNRRTERSIDDTTRSSSNRRTERSIDDHRRANERIADLKRKLLLVQQRKAPREYESERRKELNRAEQERKQGKSAPGYLEGIEPPWDDERQEILDLYDEMAIQDFEERIASIELASATIREMEEADSARKSKGGPGGQGRR